METWRSKRGPNCINSRFWTEMLSVECLSPYELWQTTNPPPKSFNSIVNICRHTCSCRRTCHNTALKPWLIFPFFFISPHPTWPRVPQTSGTGNRCSRVFRPIKQTIWEVVRMIQPAAVSDLLHHFQVTCQPSAGSAGAGWRLSALNFSQETFP